MKSLIRDEVHSNTLLLDYREVHFWRPARFTSPPTITKVGRDKGSLKKNLQFDERPVWRIIVAPPITEIFHRLLFAAVNTF